MEQQPTLHWLTWLFTLFAFFATPVQAGGKPQIALNPPSMEGDKLSLQWWVEGLDAQTVTGAEVLLDDAAIPAQPQLEPARGQAVCYMLMVDTSKSMKSYFANKSVRDLLGSLIDKKPDTHYLGLATFAKEWQLLDKPGRDKSALKALLDQVKPEGDRTELLRFTLDGLKTLDACPSDTYRKILVILSDGDAEDKAYTVEAAVQAARDSPISIYGFGFNDSNALQFPRRLAEESGGWFTEPADHLGQKREAAASALYAGSNSGGALQATLPMLQPGQQAQLRLTLSDGQTLTQSIPLGVEPVVELPAWKKQLLAWFPWLTANQLDYILWGLGLLALLLLGRIIYRASRPRPAPPEPPREPVGFLVRHGQTFPVYPGINSIGFLPTNDIVIDDDTVGRAHATLHYQGDGDVVLTDLNSLNGSYVNHNRIQRPTSVHDGDSITFGEWQALYQRAE